MTILNALNDHQPDHGAGFATAVCLAYKPGDRILTWSVAGHLPPVMRLVEGTVETLSHTVGPPLDVDPSFEYRDQAIQVSPGTLLVLYTDGLIERRDESIDVSLKRLVTELEAAPPTPKAAVDHLLNGFLSHPSSDDVAIVGALFP